MRGRCYHRKSHQPAARKMLMRPYFCSVDALLDNPVFNALCTGDKHLAHGNASVKYFDAEVSPFAGFLEDHAYGFDELHSLLPSGRTILYATRKRIITSAGWELIREVAGLQFVHHGTLSEYHMELQLSPLSDQHVDDMIALAKLTKPGPFNKRTPAFGHYHGIFDGDQLIAMTGQRLHPGNYAEISAVCTHPGYLGKGYAAALIQHQLNIICRQQKIPFLHVRDDNTRAIALYHRLGFQQNGPMNFYFMKRK